LESVAHLVSSSWGVKVVLSSHPDPIRGLLNIGEVDSDPWTVGGIVVSITDLPSFWTPRDPMKIKDFRENLAAEVEVAKRTINKTIEEANILRIIIRDSSRKKNRFAVEKIMCT
jgi:hypothetical protein